MTGAIYFNSQHQFMTVEVNNKVFDGNLPMKFEPKFFSL